MIHNSTSEERRIAIPLSSLMALAMNEVVNRSLKLSHNTMQAYMWYYKTVSQAVNLWFSFISGT